MNPRLGTFRLSVQGCAVGVILFNMEEEAALERERSEIVFWLFSDVGVEASGSCTILLSITLAARYHEE